MEFRRLLPEPADVDVRALLGSLELASRAPSARPYTIVNFVASADGRATFGGHSGGLGDDGDREMFHSLREQVDGVLAGTVTMRTEGYGRMLGKEERRRRRAECGLSPEPVACLVTRGGEIPTEIPLFAEPEARIIVFSAADLDLAGAAAEVIAVRVDPGELTLTTALRALRADHGIRTLLCEGGPTLFGALLGEGLVDELFLTLAPKLTGGGAGLAITAGPELADSQNLELEWLLERNSSLYLRYGLRREVPADRI